MIAKANGENSICVTNKNKTRAHLYHVLLLRKYSCGTLTQNLPEAAGGTCLFLPILQRKGFEIKRVTCLGLRSMLATVRRAHMGPSLLSKAMGRNAREAGMDPSRGGSSKAALANILIDM